MTNLNEEGQDEEQQSFQCQEEPDMTNARIRELKDAVNIVVPCRIGRL